MVDGIVHPGNRNTMVVLLKASLWGGAKLPQVTRLVRSKTTRT